MNKPNLKPRNPIMDYDEMINFVEKKYNIITRDYKGLFDSDKGSHFDIYQKTTGDEMPFGKGVYPDTSGKYKPEWQEKGYEGWTIFRNNQRIKATKKEYDNDFKLIHDQYKRYQEWTKTNPEPPYLDYWHWLLDNCFSDIHNGCDSYLNLGEIIQDKTTPDWVVEISKLIYTEFKEYLDSDGGIEVHISW